MPDTILILEDHPDRVAEFLAVAAELFPRHAVRIEDDAATAIAWLADHQAEVDLISLDHDLDSVPRAGEARDTDHGCGRDVADFLATRPATCPAIVHSANDVAGSGMFFALTRAGWPVWRVLPRDHHDWVRRDWRQTVLAIAATRWLAGAKDA